MISVAIGIQIGITFKGLQKQNDKIEVSFAKNNQNSLEGLLLIDDSVPNGFVITTNLFGEMATALDQSKDPLIMSKVPKLSIDNINVKNIA